ncbi:hypothetical protein PUN28_010893 [Cardiocondyla obscurior]|uniref:Uncharacterized protein n=1 Tax=Cardiocondyla obscurior TaxID=286306 RepID=A0AAW2FI85_9HYME
MSLPATPTETNPEQGTPGRKKIRRERRKTKTALTPELVPTSPSSPPVGVARAPQITFIQVFSSQQPFVGILKSDRTDETSTTRTLSASWSGSHSWRTIRCPALLGLLEYS